MIRSLALGVLCASAIAFEAPAPTYRAEDLAESIGLCADPHQILITEGRWKGHGTKYPLAYFTDLGVRYYRMGLKNDLTRPDVVERVTASWDSYGVRPLMLIDPRKSGEPADFAALVKQYPPGCLVGIEGPNEVNNKFPPQDLNLKYDGKTDEAAGVSFMRDYIGAMRADPAMADIPVINFTAIFTDYALARPFDGFDFNNMHSYQGYGVPSSSLVMNVTRANNILPDGAVTKPFMPTECGYNVELDVTNQQGYTGNAAAQARYIPMLLAEYFRHGIARSYLFALHNADGYGLLESDQETKRPSWFALQSFMAEIGDAAWDPSSKQCEGGTDFTPTTLLVSAPDAPDSIHSLSLQKADGSYRLLLWNEVTTFDPHSGTDQGLREQQVSLRFGQAMESACEILTQDETGHYQVTTGTVSNDSLSLAIGARVSIVRLRAKAGSDTTPPNAVGGLSGSATENSVRLEWNASTDTDHAGWFVFRDDGHVATVTTPSFAEANAWIRPALGYRYAVQAFDTAGNTSERSAIVVTTPNKRPDLVVTDFGPDLPPGSVIKPGDTVSFRGTITNVGEGATPHGVPAAITFAIDGQVIGWAGDGGAKPLAPGESRTYVADAGPSKGKWTATEGGHLLRVVADDINRISCERDESNNAVDRSLHVGTSAGQLDVRSMPASWQLDLSKEGSRDWIAFAQGGVDKHVRKADVTPLIGKLSFVGQGHRDSTGGSPVRLSWTDGTDPTAREVSHDGLWGNCTGNGYAVSIAAGTEERTARIYVSAIEGATGRFTASLSDGSIAEIVSQETWRGNRGNGNWSPVPGSFSAVYEVRFASPNPNTTLDCRWELAGEPNQFKGQIRLQAITVQ
ncbi:MAG: hypothetical protein PF961_09240 [Planctomycetota bacterium]|jgi:hypothetical protein|nr:hypothetical protein [Planctomycetota bacterium]